jgi:nucleotide-binding universal stress UspA family protein
MMDLKRVLVPVDGSSLAEKALPMAKTLTQKFGSPIILLRVLKFFRTVRGGYQEVFPSERLEVCNAIYQEAKRYLQTQQAELQRQGIETRILLCPASPDKDVVDIIIAQNVDLIVMTTYGRSGLARWVSGSVADEVVRHGHCPVLLVRQSEKDDRPRRGKLIPSHWYWLQTGRLPQFFNRGTLAPQPVPVFSGNSGRK